MVKSLPQRKKCLKWKEHFYEVLSVACEKTDFPEGCQLDVCEESIEMDMSSFTIQEVRRAITRLTNGKAPGVNNISAGMLHESQHRHRLEPSSKHLQPDYQPV